VLERRQRGGHYRLVNGRHQQGQGDNGEDDIATWLRSQAGRNDGAGQAGWAGWG